MSTAPEVLTEYAPSSVSLPSSAAQLGIMPALSWTALRAVALAADSSSWTPSMCFGLVKQEKWQQYKDLRKRVPIKPRGCSKGTLPKQQCLPSAQQTCSSHCPVLSILELIMCMAKIIQACRASSAPISHSFLNFASLGFGCLWSPSQPWKIP